MARKLIDISVPLQNDVPADPPGGHPTIQYINHQQGLPRMLQFFEGLKAEDLPDGQGWAVEQVSLSTHNGTHLDAPWHFHPTMFAELNKSRQALERFTQKEWISILNMERDWLKHGGQPHMEIHCSTAAFMIARAASKVENWSPRIVEFKIWLLANLDRI